MLLINGEFLIIFKDVSTEKAEEIWKRILAVFNQINELENRSYIISVSHGIVDFNNKNSNHIDALIHEADKKMYEEKQILKSQVDSIKNIQLKQ